MEASTGDGQEVRERLSPHSWWIVCVLSLACAVSYIDRQSLALVSEALRRDLGFSDTQLGLLYGAFAVFYALASVPIAWLVDRRSRRQVIAAGIALWSVATMAFGVVSSFSAMYLARIGVGVGEACLVPATYSLLGDQLPRSKLPFAMNVFHIGAVAGSGFAFIFGGWLVSSLPSMSQVSLPVVGEIFAWQLLFFCVGAPALLLIALIFSFREPRRKTSNESSYGVKPGSWRGVWSFYRLNWKLILFHHLGATFLLLLGYSFVFWTPSFFERVHGIKAEDASITFGIIFIVSGVAGCIVSAKLSQQVFEKGNLEAPLLVPMYAALLLIPIIGAIQVAPSSGWAFTLYVPAMFLINAPYGLLQGGLIQVTPPEIRARVAAGYMVFSAIGNAFGPALVGFFNDRIFTEINGLRYSMLVMCGVFGIGGVLMLALIKKTFANRLREVTDSDRYTERLARSL